MLADEAGIGRTAPGLEQVAVLIELHDRGRRQAAARDRPVRSWIAELVDRLAVGIGDRIAVIVDRRVGRAGLIVGQRARPLDDPDVVVAVHREAADLTRDPVVG
jgi:hypothetical protein